MTHRIPPSMDEADSYLPLEVGRWYVVRTLPRQEQKAEASLRRIGARTYLPREIVWYRPPGKGREREKRPVPMIAGYMFAELTADQVAEVLRQDNRSRLPPPGVMGIVRDGDGNLRALGRADVAMVHWMAHAELCGQFDTTYTPAKKKWRPAKGDLARVTVGHFAGKSGPITGLKGKNRALVLLTMFGRTREYDIPLSEMEAA